MTSVSHEKSSAETPPTRTEAGYAPSAEPRGNALRRKILHVVPGLAQQWNGIAGAAKDIARHQRELGFDVDLVETRKFAFAVSRNLRLSPESPSSAASLSAYAEIWVHSNWWPPTLMSCWRVIRAGVPLVRMTHANLDPVRYRSKWWKKVLVAPFERWLYRHTARVVVTCEAERAWCQDWGVKGPFEILDLKRFYTLDVPSRRTSREEGNVLRVLFLGRTGDPLKGVRFLTRAVEEIASPRIDLRLVSDHFGAELERDWAWCDVLCLPTLSENFGRVIAEALARGKRVITTDGAPAWAAHGHDSSLVYLHGYRAGDDATRVELLKKALRQIIQGAEPQ